MNSTRKHSSGGRTGPPVVAEPKDLRPVDDSSFMMLRDNVTEVLRILVLRRWVFFVPFCLVACLAAIGSHRIPRTYSSSTTFERRDHPVLMSLRQTAATAGFAGFFRPTLAQDLIAPEAMAEVVANLGLAGELPREADGVLTPEAKGRCQRLGTALAAGINVRLRPKDEHLDQIEVEYTGPDPSIPQRLVSEVKNTYIRRTRTRMLDLLNDVKTYFDGLARQQRQQMDVLEEDLLRFESEYVGIDPTNPGDLKLKLLSLEAEQSGLRREIGNLEREVEARGRLLEKYQARRIESFNANVGGAVQVPPMAKSADAAKIESEIRSLQSEIHELQLTRRMTDLHPDIIERRNRISRLQELLKVQYLADVNSLPANRGVSLDDVTAKAAVDASFGWDAEVAGLDMEVQDRQSRIDGLRQRLGIVEDDIARHEELQANIYKYRKEYNQKSEQLSLIRAEHAANVVRAGEIVNILNADESERGVSFTDTVLPTACWRPVKPRSSTVLALVLLAGLAAGAVCVLLKELFDQTYHTTRQVTRSLGVAILETIDEIVVAADRARLFRRRMIYAPVAITVLLGMVGVSCTLAFLSVESPGTYQRVMHIPDSFWKNLTSPKPAAAGEAATDPTRAALGHAAEPARAGDEDRGQTGEPLNCLAVGAVGTPIEQRSRSFDPSCVPSEQ